MTKVRNVMTVEGAVGEAIKALGIEAVADVAARQPRTVYAWADADDESRGIPVRSAMRIDAALIVRRARVEALPWRLRIRRALRILAGEGVR